MIAIIGGTGIYHLQKITSIESIQVDTPFGSPSSEIIRAKYKDKSLLFLPRHGKNHQLLPHEINYRANIYALKKMGAREVISFSATGSLRKKIHPGDFAIASQYFDFIKGPREKTFFGEGLAAHVSTAIPVCEKLTDWILNVAKKHLPQQKIHHHQTYAAVDGPRLGTKAESHFLRKIGCDLVGMTNVPEVFLAREAQLRYVSIGIVTDYDCWLEDSNHQVSVSKVIETYGKRVEIAQELITTLLNSQKPESNENYRKSLQDAILSNKKHLSVEKKELLQVLEA